MTDTEKLLWDWTAFRNGKPNTDMIGFQNLSGETIKELLDEAYNDSRWEEFMKGRDRGND